MPRRGAINICVEEGFSYPTATTTATDTCIRLSSPINTNANEIPYTHTPSRPSASSPIFSAPNRSRAQAQAQTRGFYPNPNPHPTSHSRPPTSPPTPFLSPSLSPSSSASSSSTSSPASPSYPLDVDSISDSCSESSQESIDTDALNRRVTPYWPAYRDLLGRRGFALDTYRDVCAFYAAKRGCSGDRMDVDVDEEGEGEREVGWAEGYHKGRADDALCRDPGLPENLFRGTRIHDGAPVVVKAVHLQSREFAIMQLVSSPELRRHPMNHCIPVYDMIEVPESDLGFIIMEEWSSQLIAGTPCNLDLFLQCMRQCIENLVFMHKHHIAHLDISLQNLLTDYKGHYAYIDFELSYRYPNDGSGHTHGHSNGHSRPPLRISGIRGTEIPPELDHGGASDPFKVDIWALGVLILRSCKLTGYHVPELMQVVEPMLVNDFEERPTAGEVLASFDKWVRRISQERLAGTCS